MPAPGYGRGRRRALRRSPPGPPALPSRRRGGSRAAPAAPRAGHRAAPDAAHRCPAAAGRPPADGRDWPAAGSAGSCLIPSGTPCGARVRAGGGTARPDPSSCGSPWSGASRGSGRHASGYRSPPSDRARAGSPTCRAACRPCAAAAQAAQQQQNAGRAQQRGSGTGQTALRLSPSRPPFLLRRTQPAEIPC
jgi:hypothetical protein